MWLIPAVDLRGGRCVRLWQGRFEEETVYGEDPLAVARHWLDLGTRRLHVVDLDGARAGRPVHAPLLRALAELAAGYGAAVQAGGGLRRLEDVAGILDAGVRWAVLGSQAIRDPDFARAACSLYPGRILVSLDFRDGRLATEGWQEEARGVEAADLLARLRAGGVRRVIVTDVTRDGTLQGSNLDLALRVAGSGFEVLVAGGVAGLDDLRRLLPHGQAGIVGAVVGRALYTGDLDFAQALGFLRDGGPACPGAAGAQAAQGAGGAGEADLECWQNA